MSFIRRPQSVAARRALFQIHRWMGVGVAAYAFMIGLTGAAVVFRPEMQAAAYPQFFTADCQEGHSIPDATAIVRAALEAYPDYRFAGLDFPTYRRPTFLAYMTRGNEFRTVFVNPRTARVLGEIPASSWTRWLQELHFNLLGGDTGLLVNGIGAICLLVMCTTGLVIWWPGVDRWQRSLAVDFRKGWRRVAWQLHGATGFWLLFLLVLWTLTGMYFAFPRPVRGFVSSVFSLTVSRAPESNPALEGGHTPPEPQSLVAVAQEMMPAAKPARIIPPSGPRGTYLLVVATGVHGDFDASDEVSLYFDRYSGEWLQMVRAERRTAGDVVMAWLGPLHVGSFGGPGAPGLAVRIVWALTAIGFPILATTGILVWWNRVLSETWRNARQDDPGRTV